MTPMLVIGGPRLLGQEEPWLTVVHRGREFMVTRAGLARGLAVEVRDDGTRAPIGEHERPELFEGVRERLRRFRWRQASE